MTDPKLNEITASLHNLFDEICENPRALYPKFSDAVSDALVRYGDQRAREERERIAKIAVAAFSFEYNGDNK